MRHEDHRILALLRQNARISLTSMSVATEIPVSTLHDILTRRTPQLVHKSTILLNYHNLGYRTRAWFLIKVRKNTREEFEEKFRKHPNINTLIRSTGAYDYLIEGIFPDLNQFEEFLDELERHKGTKTIAHQYTLSDISREQFIPQSLEFVNAHHKQEQTAKHLTRNAAQLRKNRPSRKSV